LAQTTYQSGSGSDQLSIRANDGTLWSAWQTATVTAPLDQAPVVTASNKTVTHNQSIAASSLFTATDPEGDTITTYALKDVTGNGHFVVNGVVQATNVEIDLTAAQLAQTTYQSGSGSDQLSIRANDGTLWSAWQSVTVTAPLDQARVVTSPMITTVSTETGVSSQLPSIDSTGESSPALLSDVSRAASCEIARQTRSTAIESLPIGGAINPSFLSASFDSNSMTAPVDRSIAISGDGVIALLSQYTAAGFQVPSDTGAIVSHASTLASTSEATLVSFPNQEFNRGMRLDR
jgi:hypothetical protein